MCARLSQCSDMVLHQGEPTEVFEWFKVNTAVGNVISF